MQDLKPNRRQVVAGLGALAMSRAGHAAGQDVFTRSLGRTGEKVSMVGLGGAHIGKPKLSENDSITLIRSPIDRGINLWTTPGITTRARARFVWARLCATATAKKVFLMTKVDGRTKQEPRSRNRSSA